MALPCYMLKNVFVLILCLVAAILISPPTRAGKVNRNSSNAVLNYVNAYRAKANQNNLQFCGFNAIFGGLTDLNFLSEGESAAQEKEELGNKELLSGIYNFRKANLQGTLTLNAQGDKNAVFLFIVNEELTFQERALVKLVNKARKANVIWRTWGNVKIGSKAKIEGTIFSAHRITTGKSSVITGRAISNATESDYRKHPSLNRSSSVGPDLSITKTVTKYFYSVGNQVTYTITVKNEGTTTETGARVNDILPAGYLTYVSSQPTPASFPNYSNGIWKLNSLAPGDSATLRLVARVTGGDIIVNVATVTLATGRTDVNFQNNTDVATICATPTEPGAITGPETLCVLDSNQYAVSGIPGVGYTWTVPPTWSISSGQGTNSIVLRPGVDTLTAYIYVQAITTCDSSSVDSLKVVATKRPDSLSVVSGDSLVCENTTGHIYMVVTGSFVDSLVWSFPSDWVITAGQGTDSVVVTAGVASGTISVVASNKCGESVPSVLPVRILRIPQTLGAIIPPVAGNPCIHQDSLIYTIPADSNVTFYNWTLPAGWSIVSGDSTNAITVISGTASGTITVTGENKCGTGPSSSIQVTTLTRPPDAPITIFGDPFPCLGQANVAYSVPVLPDISGYNWTVPPSWTLISGQGTSSILVNISNAADTIKVNAINGCGTGLNRALAVTPQAGPPAAPGNINAVSSGSPCVGQTNFIYAVPPVPGASSYNWTLPTGWQIVAGSGNDTITVMAGTTAGVVSVSAANGCGSSAASTITVTPVSSPPPAPGNIFGNSVPCVGTTSVNYAVVPVTGAISYTWTLPTGWAINTGQGTDSIEVTPGAGAGQITVVAVNNCGNSPATILPVSIATTFPGRPGVITGDSSVCQNQSGLTYTVNAVPNASAYDWTVPGGWTIQSGQGTNTIVVGNVITAGFITVAASNGCGSGLADTLAITLSTAPPVAANPISGSLLPCRLSTATYTTNPVAGATSYFWTVPNKASWLLLSGQGTTSITVQVGPASGNITVAPENGCGRGAFSTVVVKPAATTVPVVSAISGPSIPCIGQTNLTYVVNKVTGATNYVWTAPNNWQINSGNGTNAINVTVGSDIGQVTVVVSNLCGTSLPKVLAVTPVTSAPDSSGTIRGPRTLCFGKTTTYIISHTAGADVYTWTFPSVDWQVLSGLNNDTITVITGSAGGNITAVASNGCGAAPASVFAVSPSTMPPALNGLIAGRDRICEGEDNLTYTIKSVTGAISYKWTVPNGWQLISGQGTTSITVKSGTLGGNIMVEAENDCGRSATVIFVVNVRTKPELTGKIKIENLSCTTRRYSVSPAWDATAYDWAVPKGWVIKNGQGTAAIQVVTSADTGMVIVQAQNDGCFGQSLKVKGNGSFEIDIPNAFSPNNDGINDVWEIPELEGYPDNELTVINRWGNEVYKQQNYRNDWEGKGLSAGTYFYILRAKLCDEVQKTFKGYIMIVR
jgi:gliding motility-associated-like protein/uncharacterized repeat protein (TIGR01451 family)